MVCICQQTTIANNNEVNPGKLGHAITVNLWIARAPSHIIIQS